MSQMIDESTFQGTRFKNVIFIAAVLLPQDFKNCAKIELGN